MKINLIILALLPIVILGCSSFQSTQQKVVEHYAQVADKVSLGMHKEQVEQILSPSQQGLKYRQLKQPDQYKQAKTLVEILYFRSGWQADGITTDDEFTPYVFNDNLLVAIGWATLGGPKTQGQTRPKQNAYSATILQPPILYLKQIKE